MSKYRICFIGPFSPYKGGIAQYDDFLAQELLKRSDLYCISYKRQYPGFLINNRSQFSSEIEKNQLINNNNIEFSIDSVNPLTYISALKKIIKFKPDLVILPWWVIYWAPMYKFLLFMLRRYKIKSLLVCHNIYEHEDGYFKKFISNNVLKMSDYFILHSESEKNKLVKIVKGKKIIKHLLPVYGFSEPQLCTRSKKNSNTLNLLYFGFVRKYKGLDLLLDAIRILDNKNIYLTIVGEFWEGEYEYTNYIDSHKLQNITIINRYVESSEIEDYFEDCDAVVLPYRSATGSAVIATAYGYHKPVIVTNVGGLPDAVADGKTGIVVEPDSVSIAEGIDIFITSKDKLDYGEEIKKFVLSYMSWTSMADEIYKVIENNEK